MAEFATVGTAVGLLMAARTVAIDVKSILEELRTADEKMQELLQNVKSTVAVLNLLEESQEQIPDTDLEPHLKSLKHVLQSTQEAVLKLQREEVRRGKPGFRAYLQIAVGQGMAKRNAKVVGYGAKLKEQICFIQAILIAKVYWKLHLDGIPPQLQAMVEDPLLPTLKLLAWNTGDNEQVKVSFKLKGKNDKEFREPEMDEGEDDDDRDYAEREDDDDSDGDLLRGARLGGVTVKSRTKVRFEMTGNEKLLYFHVLQHTEGKLQPNLLFPSSKSADHTLRSGNKRTFPQNIRYTKDPPQLVLTKTPDVEMESTTLYLVFSSKSLIEEGGSREPWRLDPKLVLEEFDEVIAKTFAFEIVDDGR